VVPAWNTVGAACTYIGAAAAALLLLGGSYRASIGGQLTRAACAWGLRYGAALAIGMAIYILMSAGGSYPSLLSAAAGTAGYAGCALGLRLSRQPHSSASARGGAAQAGSSAPRADIAEAIVPELVSQM